MAAHLALTVARDGFRVSAELHLDGAVALAGPSGAGKTTLVHAVAGLVTPEAGRIEVDGEVWFDAAAGIDLPPERRAVGMVFQDLALFPHMTVAANVAFGAAGDAGPMLERFGLVPLAGRRPPELSGGEQRRVALARAMARSPRLLLLDEPLSGLDAATHERTRAELRGLLAGLDVPALIVTHDFVDAAVLAQRVAVLDSGTVVQQGTPQELAMHPANPAVAALTGMNLLVGTARRAGDVTEVALDDGVVVYSTDDAEGSAGVVIAPWDVTIAARAPEDSALNHVAGTVRSVVPLGNRVRVTVGPLVAELTQRSAGKLGLVPGAPAVASFKATAARLVRLEGPRETP